MTAETSAEIQKCSASVRRRVTVLWAITAALVVLERFSAATIEVIRSDFANAALRTLGAQAVAAVPEVLFLLALWWIRDALSAFARGELFAPPVTRMLDRVGVLLAIGAAMQILLVPGLRRLLGLDPGYLIAFDATALVLGAIGLAFKALAGVLRRASAIEAELSEIF